MSKHVCKAPVFKPSGFWSCFILLIILSLVIAMLAFVALFSEAARCLIRQYLFRIKYCRLGNSADFIDLNIFNNSPLRTWLNNHSAFMNYVVWEKADNDGTRKAYEFSQWSLGEQYQLYEKYHLIRSGGQTNLPEAPPHTNDTSTSGSIYSTNLESEIAWQYFLSYIALAFVNDLENRVNWSITNTSDYTELQIRHIFDSRYYYLFDDQTNMYLMRNIPNDPQPGIESSRINGYATLGDPVRIYQFFLNNDLIGNTQEETIGNVIGWCQDNLIHYSGSSTAENSVKHWQFDGLPPVERVLNGTTHGDRPNEGIKHYTAGCWGTTGFLKVVMRVVNIPVRFCHVFNHSMPCFMREQLYLSHGDDPYNTLVRTLIPPYQAADILINEETYSAWFDYITSDLDDRIRASNNIGRQTCVLAVQYLSRYVVKKYCDDIASGASHAAGEVITTLNRGHDNQYFTVAELETTYDLWGRMDAYLDSIGGCSNVNYP